MHWWLGSDGFDGGPGGGGRATPGSLQERKLKTGAKLRPYGCLRWRRQLGVAVGGAAAWPGGVDDSTKDPDSEEDKPGKGKKNGNTKGQQHNPAGHGNNA
ncbi:hypothetical protein TRIUR3_30671 [Triticum urartu]|uniref:Uncharacterized protein n=1 Tax=Triticum urartu TaxID=4572 RepID=M7Z9L1_TRIUA|nr:hypothetical protein TRIUR3_30671 [Triticum urartu]